MSRSATLFVNGSAEREVDPDEVLVLLRLQTEVLPDPQGALAHAAEMRARVR